MKLRKKIKKWHKLITPVIISTLGIFLSFLTLIEMKTERRESVKPILIIEESTIKVDCDASTNHHYGLNNFNFKIKNIGLGVATDIKLTLELPLESIDYFFCKKNGLDYSIIDLTGDIRTVSKTQTIKENPYITSYPYIENGTDITFNFPDSYTVFLEEEIYSFVDTLPFIEVDNLFGDSERECLTMPKIEKFKFPEIKVKLEYKDTTGNNKKTISRKIMHVDWIPEQTISLIRDGYSFKGKITFE